MRVVLAGASGVIGTELKSVLRASGHQVDVLLRRATSTDGEDSWDPQHGLLDPNFLIGADAVICLSGVGVGDHRWTESYKQEIIESRVDSVGTVARTLAGLADDGADVPKIFISASAVGYYGDRGDAVLTEKSSPGDGFLAEVCTRWEAAALPAAAAGIRTAQLRTGLVLTGSGGLLKRLTPIVKLGAGGKLGSGKQFMPWITLHDEVRAIEFVLNNDLVGAVNLTAPAPAPNAEFTKALGSLLHRPTVFPTPGFALKLVLGEFGGEAIASQRAVPTALEAAGFEFTHADLDGALRWALEH
jgi:uncharacterized protein (TIGR01777 family)